MANTVDLSEHAHWVFDMDGTLTQAAHDFPAIRRMLGIPPAADILGYLDSLPADERAAKHQQLWAHEDQLARTATPAVGAVALVSWLHARGARLGILTRNHRALALTTLRAVGLAQYFPDAVVLGRDEAQPKPAPDGLKRLAATWQVPVTHLVMVGDSIHDMEAGYRAGLTTLLVNYAQALPLPWPEKVSAHFTDCAALLECLQASAN